MFRKLRFYYDIYKRFGPKAVGFLVRSKFKSDRLTGIRIKGIRSDISLSNYGPDVTTLFQVFYAGEYNFEVKNSPTFIIDCGANIGLSAIFFANKYPAAKVVAIEPGKENFIYLQKNLKPYQNVICINKAIWSKNVSMEIKDMGTGNWSLQTVETNESLENSIESITIGQVMSAFSQENIDILKIDIEGAEKELFKHNFEPWLRKTRMIAIELHDWLDKEIPAIFYKAIDDLPNRKYYKGENLICEFSSNDENL